MSKITDPNILFDEKVIMRFVDKLELGENGCIEWTDALNETGYGRIRVGGRNGEKVRAHRWAFQFALGGVVLPSDVFICHKCDNPKCVNPTHLFPGSHKHNMQDMKEKGRAAVSFGNASLNWNAVDDIRSSSLTGVELAEKYGVVRSTISEIRNHLIWKEENREKAILK